MPVDTATGGAQVTHRVHGPVSYSRAPMVLALLPRSSTGGGEVRGLVFIIWLPSLAVIAQSLQNGSLGPILRQDHSIFPSRMRAGTYGIEPCSGEW